MKKLHFRYEMTLNLSQEVVDHHFLVHCRPMASEGQGLIGFSCHVDPEVALNHVTDGFGNQGLGGVIRTPHDRFHVTAEGEVDVRVYRMRDYHPMYRFQTPYTAPDERMLDFLRETERMLRGPIRGLDELNFLMGRLYGRFVYAPGVTTTRTTAAEAFAGGRGGMPGLCACLHRSVPGSRDSGALCSRYDDGRGGDACLDGSLDGGWMDRNGSDQQSLYG